MSTIFPSTTLESWPPSYQNTKKLNFKEFQNFIAKIQDFKRFRIFVENKIFFSTVLSTPYNLDETALLGDFKC